MYQYFNGHVIREGTNGIDANRVEELFLDETTTGMAKRKIRADF